MDIEELKVLSRQLRERTGEAMYFCRKALAINDYDVDKAEAWFKLHYFDSHCFVRERK